jgi:hypothetical protein
MMIIMIVIELHGECPLEFYCPLSKVGDEPLVNRFYEQYRSLNVFRW